MQKRSSKARERDANQTAHDVLQHVIRETEGPATPEKPEKPDKPEKNPAAVTLGRLGGLKGGKARAERLSPRKRSEIAQKAAKKRWGHR
jgi:hypothetical protein